jgi:tetratricopeptide (TPR) repeat protein
MHGTTQDESSLAPTNRDPLHLAIDHCQAGRLTEAETICLELVQSQQATHLVLYLLAEIAKLRKQLEQAAHWLERAVDMAPALAEYRIDLGRQFNNLGNAAKARGELEAAISYYCKAILFNHTSALSHFNLALALSEQGKTYEAISAYRTAIGYRGDYVEAHCNLGVLLKL